MTGDTLAGFTAAAMLGSLPDGRPTTVVVRDRRVLLLRRGRTVHATDEKCPHAGASLMSGDVDGTIVTCVAHCWRFDLVDGHCLDSPAVLQVHTTRVEGDQVLVRLEHDEACSVAPPEVR